MPLQPGDPAPRFVAPTPSNPRYEFHMAAGRYLLLAFLPADAVVGGQMLERLGATDHLFSVERLAMFGVLRDPASCQRARDRQACRWILDVRGEVSAHFGAIDAHGRQLGLYVLLDPTLRVLDLAPWNDADGFFRRLPLLPAPALHTGAEVTAPILLIPRIFEPEFCQALVALHDDRGGGTPTGVMRQTEKGALHLLSDHKKRQDVLLEEGSGLRRGARDRLIRRLVPEIQRAFQFPVSWIERYLVACYDSGVGGYFRPHRDDTTDATAHRRFACSINLNAEDFEGGDLRFPEFGERLYRPPTGGAVVFSCALLHEVLPVTCGKRYAFLPFLHDNAAEKVRQAKRANHTAAELAP